MEFFNHSSLRAAALILICTGSLFGCLRPITEQTFRVEVERAASIFGVKRDDTFGVCSPFAIDRRGTGLYVWNEFVRQRVETRQPRAFAGYEVAVRRGESCHLRIVDTFQAAVHFDLATLPTGAAVTSAELVVNRLFSPLDSPYGRDRERCTVMLLGQATESWDAGIFAAGLPDGPRAFIPSRLARPDAGPHNADGVVGALRLNVTNTVSEWVRGVRPNHGFVITPDLEQVVGFYNAMDEGGFFCDIGITGFTLVVTAAVPE